MKPTIKQIAELSGVHRSTVDKVLHDRIGVSKEVREHVQKIIDELQYQPNAVGKALALQKNPLIIAVVLLKVDALDEIKRGVEAAFSELSIYGLAIKYYISNDNDLEDQLKTLKALEKINIAGLIISPIDDEKIANAINELAAQNKHVILVNTDLQNCEKICFIGQDAKRAGRVAGKLMGEILNCRGNVAVITSAAQIMCAKERQLGFINIVSELYPQIKISDIVETYEQADTAYNNTLELLKNKPDTDGIFVTCGNVAEVARAVLSSRPTKKIKMICFDFYPEIVRLVKDGVIDFTIGQDLFGQGYRSLNIMYDRLFFNKHPESLQLTTKIDIRLSENIDME